MKDKLLTVAITLGLSGGILFIVLVTSAIVWVLVP